MAGKNPFKFLQEVRFEAVKITWPARRESLLMTLMVFVLSTLAALFFLFVDQILSWALSYLPQLSL